jgi:lipopolysaccharide transport system permease protein
MNRSRVAGWIYRSADDVTSEAGADVYPHWLPMLMTLAQHEFRLRYRARSLGPLWSLVQPAVMMGLLSLVLSHGLSTGKNYPIRLLIGLIVWSFVSTSTNASVAALVQKADVVKRTMVPRQLVPLSVMLSYAVNLLLESLTLLVFIPFFPSAFRFSPALIVLLPVFVFLLLLLAGVALLGSVLNVIYRDVGYLVSTLLMIVFWLTPIVYAVDGVREPYRSLLELSPLAGILEAIRGAIMNGEFPAARTWLVIAVPSIVLFLAGLWTFRRLERVMLDAI